MFLAIVLAIIGCNVTDQRQPIDSLSENEKHNFYLEFQNKAIIFGGERDTSVIIIKTYDSTNKVNEYFLVKNKDATLSLFRENITYDNDSSIIDPETKILTPSIMQSIKKCKALGIKGITSAWKVWGVDLHIMLEGGDVRLYVLHPDSIRHDILLKSKKISNHWYSYVE